MTAYTEYLERDALVPHHNKGHGSGKHDVNRAGLFTLRSGRGRDGRQQTIDDKSGVPKRTIPKRSKSLHGLINTKPKDSRDTSQSSQRLSASITLDQSTETPRTACGWLRRCVSGTLGRRHRFQGISAPTSDSRQLYDSPEMMPIPGIGIEPPQVPDSTTSGAAARAAAAAQNQILKSVQNTRLAEPTITRDSESGIGIEVRDGGGENTECTIPVVRKG